MHTGVASQTMAGVVVAMTGPVGPPPRHEGLPDHVVRHRNMRTVEEEQIVPFAAVALGLPMELPQELDARRPATKSSFVMLRSSSDDTVEEATTSAQT